MPTQALFQNVQQIFDDAAKAHEQRATRDAQQWLHQLNENEIQHDLNRAGFDYGAHQDKTDSAEGTD